MSLPNIPVIRLDGRVENLTDYRGRVLLIVNVASQCGFTPQYQPLQALYQKLADQGLTVMGFPCNQFGGQEPGTATDIASFCEMNFGVSFPLFEKCAVNGPGTHPLYRFLRAEAPGFMGSSAIKWNFTKFLVDRGGRVVRRYGSVDSVVRIERDLLPLLGQAGPTSE
jgi:glutathione peroxidase